MTECLGVGGDITVSVRGEVRKKEKEGERQTIPLMRTGIEHVHVHNNRSS